jgi:hypothetical protein
MRPSSMKHSLASRFLADGLSRDTHYYCVCDSLTELRSESLARHERRRAGVAIGVTKGHGRGKTADWCGLGRLFVSRS